MGGNMGGGGSTGFTLPKDAADTANMSGGGNQGSSWKKPLIGALIGSLGGLSSSLGMAGAGQSQRGAPVQFDTSTPQVALQQPDTSYLDEAKRRQSAFYGGGM